MLTFCNLQAQYAAYQKEIDQKFATILKNAAFIGGKELCELENNLANYTKTRFAFACSSGTTALILALKALGIGAGDEVITTPFTFIASSEAIALLGAKPVFVDIDERDYNLDINLVQNAITSRTKAILAVSIFGQMPDLVRLKKIACENGLFLIEDAAQSFGARDNQGNLSMSVADISTSSFFPSKPLGCYGDGGAVCTNNAELAKTLKLLINHGSNERYKHEIIGLNARLDTLQAAVLNVKIKYLDDELKRRNEIAKNYKNQLKNCILPQIKDGYFSAWAQFSVRVKNREKVVNELANKGIPTAVHYPLPLHLQKAFGYLGYKKGDFAVAERVSDEILSLPFSAFLGDDEVEFIVRNFNEATK